MVNVNVSKATSVEEENV
jgi:hypothetical protein